MHYLPNRLARAVRSCSVKGTIGNRTEPTSIPLSCKAVFTGTGLGAANKPLIIGAIVDEALLLHSNSLLRKYQSFLAFHSRLHVKQQKQLPAPPIESTGNVNPSSPLYNTKSSSVSAIICVIALRSPLASFTATIFGILDKRITVSGAIFNRSSWNIVQHNWK